MTFYAVPSFIAIVIKAWLLCSSRFNVKGNGALVLLLAALLLMNLVEFSTFMLLDSAQEMIWLWHVYYAAATLAVAAGFNLFLCLTGNAASHLAKVNWALLALFFAASLIPNVVIAGIENIGYTYMRVPGSFYVTWSVYIVSTIVFAAMTLLGGYKISKDAVQRRRCLAIIVGLAPLIFSTVLIIFMMFLNVKVNATIVLSFAVIFFLITLIYSEHRYGVFQILARVPFTQEYALRAELADQVKKIESNAFGGADHCSFKDQIKKIESLYVDLAIIANDGNKSQAASALGISNATLHRKASQKRQSTVEQTTSKGYRNNARAISWMPRSRCSPPDST